MCYMLLTYLVTDILTCTLYLYLVAWLHLNNNSTSNYHIKFTPAVQ